MTPEAVLANLGVGLLALLALVLAAMALRAWWYARDGRTLLLALAFLLIVAKSVALARMLFLVPSLESWLIAVIVLDLVILALIYIASLR